MSNSSFLHIGVTCKNPKKFEDFYCRYFGFARTKTVDLENNKQLVFIKNAEGISFEIFAQEEEIPYKKAEGDGPKYSAWKHIAFMVTNIQEKLIEMGEDAIITQGPISLDKYIEGWKAVWIKDPEGNIVEIAQGYND